MEVIDDMVPADQWPEVLAVSQLQGKSDQDLMPVLSKLHRNL